MGKQQWTVEADFMYIYRLSNQWVEAKTAIQGGVIDQRRNIQQKGIFTLPMVKHIKLIRVAWFACGSINVLCT